MIENGWTKKVEQLETELAKERETCEKMRGFLERAEDCLQDSHDPDYYSPLAGDIRRYLEEIRG